MEGPAIDELARIAAATEAQVIASGGVGDLADLEALARMDAPNIEGAIVGRPSTSAASPSPRASPHCR